MTSAKRVTHTSRIEKRNLSEIIIVQAMTRFNLDFEEVITESRAEDSLNTRAWMVMMMRKSGVSVAACGTVTDRIDWKTSRLALARAERVFPEEDWSSALEKVKTEYTETYRNWPFEMPQGGSSLPSACQTTRKVI
jgi:hypothetical protein